MRAWHCAAGLRFAGWQLMGCTALTISSTLILAIALASLRSGARLLTTR